MVKLGGSINWDSTLAKSASKEEVLMSCVSLATEDYEQRIIAEITNIQEETE